MKKLSLANILTICTLIVSIPLYVIFRYYVADFDEVRGTFLILSFAVRIILIALTGAEVINDSKQLSQRKHIVWARAILVVALVYLIPKLLPTGRDALPDVHIYLEVYRYLYAVITWAVPLVILSVANHFIRIPASKTDA